MKQADIPDRKFPIPFGADATSGFIRDVPVDSQINVTPGAASLQTGFPPLNATDQAAGGVPPFMQDMNGLQKQITAWTRWSNAGGPLFFDAAFAAEIGGYPKGAVITAISVANCWWLCLVDDNEEDPDADGGGWLLVKLTAVAGAPLRPYFIACISNVVASPPASPQSGDTYLIPATGSIGPWAGKGNLVAQWDAALAEWDYVDYPTQSMVGVANQQDFLRRAADGSWSSIFVSEIYSFFLGMMGG